MGKVRGVGTVGCFPVLEDVAESLVIMELSLSIPLPLTPHPRAPHARHNGLAQRYAQVQPSSLHKTRYRRTQDVQYDGGRHLLQDVPKDASETHAELLHGCVACQKKFNGGGQFLREGKRASNW